MRAESLIRAIPDFPQPGILFRDITPVLADSDALKEVVEAMAAYAREVGAEAVAGIESRGFIFGAPVAVACGLGLVPIRKLGKLPYKTVQREYALEYGTATVEMHADALTTGLRVLIVDDLLATGGTAAAAAHLVEAVGGTVAGFTFLIELAALNGRAQLPAYDVRSLITY